MCELVIFSLVDELEPILECVWMLIRFRCRESHALHACKIARIANNAITTADIIKYTHTPIVGIQKHLIIEYLNERYIIHEHTHLSPLNGVYYVLCKRIN